jgi:hypothetical protein
MQNMPNATGRVAQGHTAVRSRAKGQAVDALAVALVYVESRRPSLSRRAAAFARERWMPHLLPFRCSTTLKATATFLATWLVEGSRRRPR